MKVKSRSKEQELNEQKIFYEREQKNNTITEQLVDLAEQKVEALKVKQKRNNDKQEYMPTDVGYFVYSTVFLQCYGTHIC